MVLSKKIKNNGGFTLLEILIALVVFVLGSVSIWSLFAVAINTYNESLDYQTASLFAETIITDFEDVVFVKGVILRSSYSSDDKDFFDYRKNFRGYKYQIKWVDLGSDALLIKLTIFYQRRGVEREFKFRTVLYRTMNIRGH
ncbi:prepilin-type N-terminal cleavage/methylation domain-containing protein [Candidatus Uabimicrobium sp. HlEnr_7]|uniref:type IV pilus modification PilV family protein n=1 Tax=Candidatus Uabimicrobium helgolandensis TaxID=3095367 RepID=UPI003558F8F3